MLLYLLVSILNSAHASTNCKNSKFPNFAFYGVDLSIIYKRDDILITKNPRVQHYSIYGSLLLSISSTIIENIDWDICSDGHSYPYCTLPSLPIIIIFHICMYGCTKPLLQCDFKYTLHVFELFSDWRILNTKMLKAVRRSAHAVAYYDSRKGCE